MSSETQGQLVTFFCDRVGCEETFQAAGRWKDVWEAAKEEGWRARHNDATGEWTHICGGCLGRPVR